MSPGENGSKLLLPPASLMSFFPHSQSHPFSKRKESLEKLFRHANVEGTTRSIQYLKITLGLKY